MLESMCRALAGVKLRLMSIYQYRFTVNGECCGIFERFVCIYISEQEFCVIITNI